jgi:hypothetical protein
LKSDVQRSGFLGGDIFFQKKNSLKRFILLRKIRQKLKQKSLNCHVSTNVGQFSSFLENCWVWVSKDFMRLAPVPFFWEKKKISTDSGIVSKNCKYFFAQVSKCKFSDNSYQLIFKGGF